MRPAVNLEDAGLIRRMFALFHGAPAVADPERAVQPASPALRVRLMALFCRSAAAAKIFPDNLHVRTSCPAVLRQRLDTFPKICFLSCRPERPLQPAAPAIGMQLVCLFCWNVMVFAENLHARP